MNWPLIISVFSLIISFSVALTNFYRSLPKIKIMQMNNALGSFFIKSYDGVHAPVDKPTVSPKMERLALIEVVITNQSSLPITIIEFKMKNSMPFNSESHTIKNFVFTGENPSSSIVLGTADKPITYIQPLITISPYTSIKGYLSFWLDSSIDSLDEKNKLTIVTSMREFTKTIYVKNKIESLKTNEKPKSFSYE